MRPVTGSSVIVRAPKCVATAPSVANSSGTLSVITESVPDEFATLGAVATHFGARTMTLDPVTGRIYLVTADYVVNANVDPADIRHRYSITPGSVKLIFLDPAR